MSMNLVALLERRGRLRGEGWRAIRTRRRRNHEDGADLTGGVNGVAFVEENYFSDYDFS